jgi:hypothetical protein
MKTTEILRGLLDIIDGLESSTKTEPMVVVDPAAQEKAAIDQEYKDRANDDVARMNQIKDLLPNPCATKEFANEPEEKYATIDSVTVDAGGGPNAPKHPADIRTDATSMYPALQFRV